MISPIRTSLTRSVTSLVSRRTYATASSHPVDVNPFPVPPTSAPLHNPELDPQLAGMGYPNLSTDSRQLRSPRGWWDSQERITFGEALPENDDLQTMWAPDVHKIKPFSAVSQLLFMFGAVAVFSAGVYVIQAPPPALPRAYPYDGLVKELSGTDDATYAARPTSANEQ